LCLLDGFGMAGVLAEFGDEFLVGGVGRDERAKDRGARGDERASRPPQMQCADVPLSYGFLAPCFGGDFFDGEIILDETFIVGHIRLHLTIYIVCYIIWLLGTKFGSMPCDCATAVAQSYIPGSFGKAAADSGFFCV